MLTWFPDAYDVGGAQQNGSTAGLTPGPGTGSAAASLLRCAAQHIMAAAADLQRPRHPFKGCTVDASAQLRLKVSSTAMGRHRLRHAEAGRDTAETRQF